MIVEESEDSELTSSEISAGWHYCYNANRKLIGPGFPEMEDCNCKINKNIHNQIKKKND